MLRYIIDTHISGFTGELRKSLGIYGQVVETMVHQ